MSLPSKVFKLGCNNTRLLSSTSGGGTADGAGNKQTGENHWKSPVKEDNKQLAREEMSRSKQEKRSKISSAWKKFE